MVHQASQRWQLRTTVIHSPGAGQGHLTRDDLLRTLEKAGHRPTYHSTTEANWPEALKDPGDLVVAAGGDGTVKRVALMVAKLNVPFAVIPMGTANNIAFTLGTHGSLSRIVRSWETAPRVRLDVGVARGPWGERRFLEAVGFGVFARTIRDADDLREGEDKDPSTFDRDARLSDDLQLLHERVRGWPVSEARLTLDGVEETGRYILVSVLSMRSVGPNLVLAPDAVTDDGVFDIAIVTLDGRRALERHLSDRLADIDSSSGAIVRRARRVTVEWHGPDIHIDDEVWPTRRRDLKSLKTPIRVEIEPTGESLVAIAPGEPVAPTRVSAHPPSSRAPVALAGASRS